MASLQTRLRRRLWLAAWLIAFRPGLGITERSWADDLPAPARIGYQDSKREVKAPGTAASPAQPGKSDPASSTPTPSSFTAAPVRPSAAGELGADATILPIDLPYALRLVNASNPTIEIARARV